MAEGVREPEASGGPGRLWLLLGAAACCLIWGTTWAAIQVGLEGVPPFLGVSLRFLIAGAVLLGIALATGVKLGRTAVERRLWVANGLLSFVVCYGVVYWVEQHLPSGLTAILFATYPLIVALLGHFMLPTEHVGRRETLFILISFAGVATIYSEDLTALGSPQARTAALVMMASPLASAFGSVLVKKHGRGIHSLSMTAVPMLLTALVMGGVSAAVEGDRTVVWDARSVGALLYLALMGSAVTFSLYFWLLQHVGVRRLSLIAYVVPVVAVTVGILRGEPMTGRILLGAGLVLLGVALTTSQRK